MGLRTAALVSAVALGAVLFLALVRLPPSGHASSAAAEAINARVVGELHATASVSGVNFGYRAIDTLGEELILFVAIIGAVTLLRRQRDESEPETEDRAPGRVLEPPLDAVRAFGVVVVLLMVVTGGYLCTHGQVTPGGGFQGGVVLASAPLVVYFAADVRTFCKIAPEGPVTVGEAAGVAGYVVVGALPLALGLPFLTNVFPLGEAGDVLSAGSVLALSISVGLAVAGGLVALALAFMHDAIERRLRARST